MLISNDAELYCSRVNDIVFPLDLMSKLIKIVTALTFDCVTKRRIF